MLVEQSNHPEYGLQIQHYWLRDSRYPFNQAECGGGTYVWATWADAPMGSPSQLSSRAVSSRELDRIRAKAEAEKKRMEQIAAWERQEREAEATLQAAKEKEASELEQRKLKRERLRERAAELERQKKEAAEIAEREKQMAQARQLEYQDAEWKAFLRALAEERSQRLAALKKDRGEKWEERVLQMKGQADDLKELKRKRAERELATSQKAWEKKQAEAAKDRVLHREAERRRAQQPPTAVAPSPDEELAPPPSLLPSHQDVDRLGVAELKKLVHAAGLSAADCLEKADLRQRAREALTLFAQQVGPQRAVSAAHTAQSQEGGSTIHEEADQPALAPSPAKPPPVAEAVPLVKRRKVVIRMDDDESDDEEREVCVAAERVVVKKEEVSADECVVVKEEAAAADECVVVKEEAAAADGSGHAAGGAPPTALLEKGTRLEIFWEGNNQWFAGRVASRWSEKRCGYLIAYDDHSRQWENLDEVEWRRQPQLTGQADETTGGNADVKPEVVGSSALVVVEGQSSAVVRRSMRHDVKLTEEDYVAGEIRCPGCGVGVLMGGACNVITCYSNLHVGGYYYFCAHCREECPDGEAYCRSCPHRNDRVTRRRLKAKRDQFLATNSAENPCVV